jgi:hypothetical protein
VLLPQSGGRAEEGGGFGGGGGGKCGAGTREAAHRLLNVMVGQWDGDAFFRATGVSEGERGGGSGALAALLAVGLVEGSQALRQLGRVTFRVAAARFPAAAEAVRAQLGRTAARQLAAVASEAGADPAALGAHGADALLLQVDSVPICYSPPGGWPEGGDGGGGGAPPPLPPPQPPPPPPPPVDPGAALLAAASHMKAVLSAVMASMTPQLALLSKLDKRAREANVRVAGGGGGGGGTPAAALSMADAVLLRAQSEPGSAAAGAPLPGAALADVTREELADAVTSFSLWADGVDVLLSGLRAQLPPV